MLVLEKLNITKLRNIGAAEISFSSGISLFYGENGSGKTSILEAIHLLGLAKSFRSNSHAPLVQNGENECAVFGKLADGSSLGFSKNKGGEQKVRINGKKSPNNAELAKLLPLQLINSDAFKILEGSPKVRRQFLDWGVFHVEHGFLDHWRQAQKSLLNRNSLLKRRNADKKEIEAWTVELSKHGEKMDEYREKYLHIFRPVFLETLNQLLPLKDLHLEYERGWDKERGLEEVLEASLDRDLKYGYTVSGPQRADLKIKIGSISALDMLSRGQQKLFVIAMKIAQGFLLKLEKQKLCLYLLDDLPAELDANNKRKVYALLRELKSQALVSGIEKESLIDGLEGTGSGLFHVKHGKISPAELPGKP